MKIVSLQAQNIMRVRAVEIRPSSNVVIVGGNNEQGKTSVLEAIAMLFGGTRVMGPEPLRKGAKSGIVVGDLGDLIITRQIKEDGGTSLEVKGKDSTRFPSPQKVLEGLIGRVCYDPIHFMNLDAQKQLSELKKIVGLDFTELDRRYASAYGQRTDVNREIEKLKGQASALPPYNESLSSDPVDAVELSRRIADADRFDEDLNEIETQGREAASLVNETREKIFSIETELKTHQAILINREAAAERLREKYIAKRDEGKATDSNALREELISIKEDNQRIARNNQRREIDEQIQMKESQLDTLERELGDVAIAKEKALTEAEFPIEGLSFNDHGVLYKGTPFEQASAAAKLRTSMAMGIALNPKIRVMIIRDGSLLDSKNLDLIKEMAIEKDMQVWIERVGDGEECTVVIEDGEIAEDRTQQAEKPEPKLQTTRKPKTGPRAK